MQKGRGCLPIISIVSKYAVVLLGGVFPGAIHDRWDIKRADVQDDGSSNDTELLSMLFQEGVIG